MHQMEYEKEFKLTPQQAYDGIMKWLGAIKATVKDYREPFYIKAIQGSLWKFLRDPNRKKKLRIDIEPLESNGKGVKVSLKAFVNLPRREKRLEEASETWNQYLFSQLWAILETTKEEEIMWNIKVTQFMVAVPEVKKESDFKQLIKKLCQHCKEENLTDDQVLQITDALKLRLLTAKLFAPSKREKLAEWVGKISKSILGDVITDVISGALNTLVDYLIK